MRCAGARRRASSRCAHSLSRWVSSRRPATLAAAGGKVRLRDCFAHPLILMTPDTELRAMFDQIDARQPRNVRPLIETGSVPMVRRLAAEGAGVGFLIAENVADDVAAGRLAWTPLADAGARSFSCIYQRADMSATVAMTMFLEFFSEAIEAMESGFVRDGGAAGKRRRAAK